MKNEDSQKFRQALAAKSAARLNQPKVTKPQGMGPNKAAGRKGGIRRQGSKR